MKGFGCSFNLMVQEVFRIQFNYLRQNTQYNSLNSLVLLKKPFWNSFWLNYQKITIDSNRILKDKHYIRV